VPSDALTMVAKLPMLTFARKPLTKADALCARMFTYWVANS